jgi:excisionase family DNA binding protein
MADDRILYNVTEAARVLSLSPWTLRRWIKEGKLESVRLGRRVLITVDELSRLVDAGRSPALPSVQSPAGPTNA